MEGRNVDDEKEAAERMMMITMMKRYEKKCEEQVLIY